MYLSSLTISNFRNYLDCSLSLSSKGAVFIGENGSGKTNILEAIHMISLGRSQRGALKRDMIHRDAHETFLEGVFSESVSVTPLSLSIGFSRDGSLILRRNNQKVSTLSELLFHNTIISFGSQDIALIYGEPAERRRFIDSILCQVNSTYLDHLVLYRKNLLNRNTLLKRDTLDRSVDIYEEKMAEYAATIVFTRKKFFLDIAQLLSKYFCQISLYTGKVDIIYKPSISIESDDKETLYKLFLKELREKREKDIVLGFTSIGPHRDDFRCYINGIPIKSYGSQGQCRAMSLSIRLCALSFLEKHTSKKSIILIDDAFTELDTKRRSNTCSLVEGRGQIFLTALSEKDIFIDKLPVFNIEKNMITSV